MSIIEQRYRGDNEEYRRLNRSVQQSCHRDKKKPTIYGNTQTAMRRVQHTRKYVRSSEILNLELARPKKMTAQWREILKEFRIAGKHTVSGCTKTVEHRR